MTGVTLIYNFLNPYPYLYGNGCGVTAGLHRFTVGFPSYCTVFYIFIINVYIIIYITKLKYPPLTFEVREGVVVAIVTHKRTQDPPTHICSEGGDGGGHCCPEKNTRTPHSCLK
jgi:hypothetical protein